MDRVNERVDNGIGSARHLTLLDNEEAENELFPIEKLWSLICQKKISENLFYRLKCVRVLSASKCNTQELPPMVGKLIHLRYLDLSGNPLKELPESLCNLYNLETLDLDECENLLRLPQSFGKLRKLIHLLIHPTPSLVNFPQGFQKLINLQTLNKFKAQRGSNNIGLLKDLNQVRGSIYILIMNLNEEADVGEAQNANLKNKRYIQHLDIEFAGDVKYEVFDALQPPLGLQRLGISSYPGPCFPSWIINSLNFLRILEIEQCHGCSRLPPLGKLQSLEKLCIKNMRGMKHLGHDFLGLMITNTAMQVDFDEFLLSNSRRSSVQTTPPKTVIIFAKLKELHFVDLPNLETWDDLTEDQELNYSVLKAFPSLQNLSIKGCPKLNALPGRLLGKVKYLKLQGSSKLIARYQQKVGVDFITAMKTLDGKHQKSTRQHMETSLLHSLGQTIFGSAARYLRFFNKLSSSASDELNPDSNPLPRYIAVEHGKNKAPKITEVMSKMDSIPYLESSGNLVLCEMGREEKGSGMITFYSFLARL